MKHVYVIIDRDDEDTWGAYVSREVAEQRLEYIQRQYGANAYLAIAIVNEETE